MEQVSDQIRQFLDRGIADVLRLFNLLWTWSSEQFIKVAQAPWESWPLWKQILFLFLVVAVVYFLFVAAIQLWTAALNVVSALATFVGAVIVTLPTILIAAAIALAGLWIINNLHDLSSLRSLMTFQTQPPIKAPHVDAP
jgi:hypothetical protein